jgi:hypothetical protein
VFDTRDAAKSGRSTYASGAFAQLLALGCGACLAAADLACGDEPGERIRRMKVALLDEQPSSDTTAPPMPTLPDPKATTTPPPEQVAERPSLLATWEVLDDICDPYLDTEYADEPRPSCQTAAYLPGYAGRPGCIWDRLRFHGDYRVDFDGTGRDQAMLVYDGCEATPGLWGGSVIVARGESGWEIREHLRSTNPSDCVPFQRSDGSMTLACTMHYGRMDVARDVLSVIGLDDWESPPPYLHDDVMHGCNTHSFTEGAPGPSEEHVYGYEATWRRFEGFDSRSEADGAHLIVQVSYALIPVTSSMDDPICRLVFPDRSESRDYRYIESSDELDGLVELEHLELDYLDDGQRLVPTEATIRTLERLQPEGRRHLGLLTPAAEPATRVQETPG